MPSPDSPIDPELVDDPEIKAMLKDFVLEAGKEAVDMLKHGDTRTKTGLVKMVLTEAFKARTQAGSQEADRALEQTRALIIESVLGADADEEEVDDEGQETVLGG